MNIDLGSLFFNATIETGEGQPCWNTALGQSVPDYKLTYPGAADILLAMDYCYCPLSNSISYKIWKRDKEITKAAIFSDVCIKVEGEIIPIDKPFILLMVRNNGGPHKGRRSLVYSDTISVGNICNKNFYNAVSEKIGGLNTCWFAYAIDAVDQNKLIFSIVKVEDKFKTYPNLITRHKEWSKLLALHTVLN